MRGTLVHFGSPQGTEYDKPTEPTPTIHFGSTTNQEK